MDLAGNYTFEAPRDVVWESLMDPAILARVIPGCEKLEKTGENQYQSDLNIKVGPVQGKFQGKISLEDVQAPGSYKLTVDGKGAPGFLKAIGNVTLEAKGNTTLMQYEGTAHVGGRLAGVGQRLLDSTAKAMTRQSLDQLHRQIKVKMTTPGISEAASATAASTNPAFSPDTYSPDEFTPPSEMEFALGVAKNMFEDLVPSGKRPLVIGGAALLGVWLFLNWWSNMIAKKVVKKMKKAGMV